MKSHDARFFFFPLFFFSRWTIWPSMMWLYCESNDNVTEHSVHDSRVKTFVRKSTDVRPLVCGNTRINSSFIFENSHWSVFFFFIKWHRLASVELQKKCIIIINNEKEKTLYIRPFSEKLSIVILCLWNHNRNPLIIVFSATRYKTDVFEFVPGIPGPSIYFINFRFREKWWIHILCVG